MQYLAKYKQSKLNWDKKRFTVSKFSANRSFLTKFLVFFCKKYDQNHPFLQEMLLWNIKFNFGTCYYLIVIIFFENTCFESSKKYIIYFSINMPRSQRQ